MCVCLCIYTLCVMCNVLCFLFCFLCFALCALRVARCALRVARCALRVARCALRVARCALRVACCVTAGIQLRITVSGRVYVHTFPCVISVAGPTKVILLGRDITWIYERWLKRYVLYVDSYLSHQNPTTGSITSPRYERVVVVLGQ